MGFCSKCGTQLSDGARFCPKCGAKVNYEDDCYDVEESRIIVTKDKSSRKKLMIVLGVFATFIICGGLWFYSDSDKPKQATSTIEHNTDSLSVADSNKESVDTSQDYNELTDDTALADENNKTDIPDWLQGHWVYDVDISTNKHYRIHVIIEGNRIIQYRNDPTESTNPTFVIEDGEIQAQYQAGMITTYKIDPVRQSIDLEEGERWMYKLGSDEEIRHRVGFENENTFFIKIANQVFRNQDGKEIRFDNNRKVYLNDVYAGTISIVELEKVKAIVSYSGGDCGEGKLEIQGDLMTKNYLSVTPIPYDGFYSQVRR